MQAEAIFIVNECNKFKVSMFSEILIIIIAFLLNEYIFAKVIKFRELKSRILSDLNFFANVIANPMEIGDTLEYQRNHHRYAEASDAMRRNYSDLEAFVFTYPYIFFFSSKKKESYKVAAEKLLVLSNSVFAKGKGVSNSDLSDEIKKVLK